MISWANIRVRRETVFGKTWCHSGGGIKDQGANRMASHVVHLYIQSGSGWNISYLNREELQPLSVASASIDRYLFGSDTRLPNGTNCMNHFNPEAEEPALKREPGMMTTFQPGFQKQTGVPLHFTTWASEESAAGKSFADGEGVDGRGVEQEDCWERAGRRGTQCLDRKQRKWSSEWMSTHRNVCVCVHTRVCVPAGLWKADRLIKMDNASPPRSTVQKWS